jgi:hypothetical protein
VNREELIDPEERVDNTRTLLGEREVRRKKRVGRRRRRRGEIQQLLGIDVES